MAVFRQVASRYVGDVLPTNAELEQDHQPTNVSDRELTLWVNTNEELYSLWQRVGGPVSTFVAARRRSLARWLICRIRGSCPTCGATAKELDEGPLVVRRVEK